MKLKLTYTTIFILFFAVCAKAGIVVTNLSVEGREDQPLGLDIQKPSFGWQLKATDGEKDVIQKEYHILVASSLANLNNNIGDLWDSDVKSDKSNWISYDGTKLKPNQRCYWKVQVTTNKGKTQWSEPSMWGVGLLNIANWKGSWIGIPRAMPWDKLEEHSQLSARYYRCKFDLKDKRIREATLHICGLGLYEAYINGTKVGNDVMTPAPTDYRKSQIYNTYDVTDQLLLNKQPNLNPSSPNPSSIISVCVTNGRFFTMQQGKKYQKITNFGFPTLIANLIIIYEDGSTQTISTDEKQWRVTADGPIRSANEYDGTIYDANNEFNGDWTALDFDDSKWQLAERMPVLTGELKGNTTPAIGVVDTVKVKEVIKKDDGRIILDFGQNISGWVSFGENAKALLSVVSLGDTIRIRHAEKLDSLGNLYVANLRHAYTTDYFIAPLTSPEGEARIDASWNHFTTHGFRYAEITVLGKEGIKQTPPLGEAGRGLWGAVVTDRMRSLGTFSCADSILNKIYNAARWGILDNYKGMPTDCPQRDERMPWLGDRAVGALGESYLFDNMSLYAKWMDDLEESQRSDGAVPDVAPAFWNYYSDNVTWPSGFIFITEMLYDRFGNIEPIRKHYNAMRKWLMHFWNDKRRNDGLIYADKYGDWCCPPESPEIIRSKDPLRITDGTLLGSCYFYRLCQSMERFDSILINSYLSTDSQLSTFNSQLYMERQGLGKNVLLADKAEFESMRQQIREAINKKFLHVKEGSSPWPDHYLYPDSIYYANNSVTANLLPLAFGIVPEKYASQLERQIVRKHILIPNGTSELKGLEGHIQCGVIGIQWLMRELTKMGRADVAYMLASTKTYPGWGYMVEHGATTIWELWNGDTANPAMNSGNHVMLLGDLLIWLYENIGGIQAAEPAFHKIRLAPSFEIQDLPFANVSYETPYGLVKSNWKKTLEHISWDISIPCNTTAEVVLPGLEKSLELTVESIESGKSSKYKVEDGKCLIGSGDYHIEYDIPVKNGIIADEFLYETPLKSPEGEALNIHSLPSSQTTDSSPRGGWEGAIPSCHASTIAECTNGDLLAAFFGGSYEGCPDVKIYTARKKLIKREYDKKGNIKKNIYEEGWEPLQMVAKGEKACYNPVLYQIPGGDLLLFYKIGKNVKDWTGYLMRSKDNGYTWSEMYGRPVPAEGTAQDSLLGAIKNKPVSISLTKQTNLNPSSLNPSSVRIIAPSSKEDRQWRCYMEISDDGGQTWRLVGPIKEAKNIRTIQPTILQHKDGSLQILCRTGKPKTEKGETPDQAKIATSWSYDNGETWSEMQLLDVPNNNSGIDAVTLAPSLRGKSDVNNIGVCEKWGEASFILVYNPFGMVEGPDKPVRNPLCLAKSTDGIHWDKFLTLEDSPISQYSYPSMIQGSDGTLHIIYTWRRQRVKYQQVDLSKCQ